MTSPYAVVSTTSKPAQTGKNNRIFWLGMHVVLTRTELPRLRGMGYEVFNPPYNSPVYDQSANLDWDREQATTLPREVFSELASYNFFYNAISPRIAELLNEHFGTVIVTINPDWLKDTLAAYNGRIIYRTYGQVGTLSEHLWAVGCGRKIMERDNFSFVPHAAEVAAGEQAWLKERMKIVPYTLPLDTFEHRDTWNIDAPHDGQIMATCPNIANGFYAEHYRFLQTHFPDKFLRLYGVQPTHIDDPRVVGTLPRPELLSRYRRASGYFYSYDMPNVCYLPPIEMMTIGGPVVFLRGSLLARYFQPGAPGAARDPLDARRLMKRLIDGDRSYIQDVLESQREVRKRYAPEHVHPIFDETISELVASQQPAQAPFTVLKKPATTRKRIYMLFHFPGGLIGFKDGEYTAAEGIPRVMRKLAHTVLDHTEYDVVVTCRNEQLQEAFGYFRTPEFADRVSFLRIDDPANDPNPSYWRQVEQMVERCAWATWRRTGITQMLYRAIEHTGHKTSSLGDARRAISMIMTGLAVLFYLPTRGLYSLFRSIWNRLVELTAAGCRKIAELREGPPTAPYVRVINSDTSAACVLIPHYYLFNEATALKVPSVLYLPDYLPHFVTEPFEGNAEPNVRTGQEIARRVVAVLTNSEFTRSYLPECDLKVAPEKICVAPIPLLMPKRRTLDAERVARLRGVIGEGEYLFYPTQNRPNKQIAFLLRLFAKLVKDRPKLKLILTCGLDHVPEAREVYNSLGLKDSVVLLSGVPDEELAYLYEHAAVLPLTSTMEGNFPPQVFEALTAGTPVVATRLPLITEILGNDSDSLLLCQPLNETEFLAKIWWALEHREQVLQQQKIAYARLMLHADDSRFGAATAAMFQKVAA